ncbi:MAG: DedA family protein [Marinifilaceae bacterium]
MNYSQFNIKRFFILILLATMAIMIASLTIGQDIYYGSRGQGLLSFAIVNLAGYLFFLLMPVELAFFYYLTVGENLWMLNIVAFGTALISQSIDYIIGYSFSTQFIDHLIGRKHYAKAEARIRKYGNIAIFVFNFLPLSSPVILLTAGMLKYSIKDALIFSFLGLGLKYLSLSLIWGFFA